MAGGPISSPRFSLNDHEVNSVMKRSEEVNMGQRGGLLPKFNNKRSEESSSSVPSDAERQSIAAIRAVVDEDEDDMESSSRLDAAGVEEQGSHVVDLGDRSGPPAESAANPTSFWTRLQTGWSEVEDQLAEWFGLDQSKYQWAVNELLERQIAGDHPASKTNLEGLQMQNIEQQTMQRDSKGSNHIG